MSKYNKTPRRVLTIATLLGVFAAVLVDTPISAQSRQERQLIARAEAMSGDRFPVRTRTPNGVLVYAQRQPTSEVMRVIDSGFGQLFAVARRRGFRSHLDFSSYTVFIARADRAKDSTGAYSPDVAVPSGQYTGSGYDQGGFVYAAGMVLAFSPSAFLIAEHERDIRRISDIVRFEGEHIILYHNDRSLYEKTKDHSKGGGHPILQ